MRDVLSFSNFEEICLTNFYTPILRLFVLILHDYPEFFVVYHQFIIDVLPKDCIQIRNFVTSAVPKGIYLPNPLSPDLKVDLLPEMQCDVPMDPTLNYVLSPKIQNIVLSYFNAQQDFDIKLVSEASCQGRLYLFCLYTSLKKYQNGFVGSEIFSNKTFLFYKSLLKSIDRKSRYDALGSIIDQLRYPNRQTYFSSCLLLALFLDTVDKALKEQITRYLKLFERI